MTDINGDEISVEEMVKSLREDYGYTVNDECTEVTIPEGIKEVGYKNFYNCDTLETIHLPKSVKEIDDWAFDGCSKLKNIDFSNLEVIRYSAFSGCDSLTNIVFSKDLKFIDDYAFAGCDNLVSITFPENYNESYIGESVFNACTSLANVDMQYGVIGIGGEAFNFCTSLTKIELPESVREIGEDAFKYCSELREIELPDGLNISNIGLHYKCHVTFVTYEDEDEEDFYESKRKLFGKVYKRFN